MSSKASGIIAWRMWYNGALRDSPLWSEREYGQSAAGRASTVRLKFAQAQQALDDRRVLCCENEGASVLQRCAARRHALIAQAPVAGGAEQGRVNRV